MWNAGLDEAQARIKIVRRNINNNINTDSSFLNIIKFWYLLIFLLKYQKMERKSDKFIFLGSKITVKGDCRHEIKDTCSF